LVRAIPAAAALELDCHTRNVARPNQIAVAVLYGTIKLPTGRGLGKGSRQEPVGNRAWHRRPAATDGEVAADMPRHVVHIVACSLPSAGDEIGINKVDIGELRRDL